MKQPFASLQPIGDMRSNDAAAENVKAVRSEYQNGRDDDYGRDE